MMDAQRTGQPVRQVYREAEPVAASAKSVNQTMLTADAGWRALVANAKAPRISLGASVPVNAIAGQSEPDKADAALALGKWPANQAVGSDDAARPALLENSTRPSIEAGFAAPVNAIETLRERTSAT